MHHLLQRQLKQFFPEADETLSVRLAPLFEAISEIYLQSDIDRQMIERSLDILSQEMLGKNRVLADELKRRRATELQLEQLTNYDGLTGLVNRLLLNDRLRQAIANAERQSQKVAVLVLGLDHFKLVNDSLGQDAGNDFLKITSGRLRSCFRSGDTVARLGGDEFAIVLIEQDSANRHALPNRNDTSHFEPYLLGILERVLRVVSQPAILAGRELQITCSIGLSLYPQDGDSEEALLQNADAAMINAKQLGRNNFQFYTDALGKRIRERLVMQGELRKALERNEFVLHYQPQVDLSTGCIIGMEALIHWNHPRDGMLMPECFIGLAEETGLIVPIGAWIIRTACEQCKAWQQSGSGKPRVAVNLSVRQFTQSDLLSFMAGVLAETGLDAQLLEIGLTESVVMTNIERSIDILRGLKALDLKLSIDDFGTGYSSLACLRRFPINALKIDRSFVHDVETSDAATIVKTIISMAHSLGVRVIAEGVETETQCRFLQQNGCDEIQGALFSKPLTAHEMTTLLQESRRLPEHLLRLQKPPRTLLLVDDETSIVSALKRLLRRDNYTILTANSGQAGLDILEKNEVDVIISDQRMPGMTGVEFLSKAKLIYPDTIRIVLSGYTELQSVTDAVNEGAIYKFLTKPWDDVQLRGHVEEAFRRKEMADENLRLNLEVRAANFELATVNRRLEEVLKQQQQQITRDEVSLCVVREALQHVPVAVVGLDEERVIAFVNNAAQPLFRNGAAILGCDADAVMPELLNAVNQASDGKCSIDLDGRIYQVKTHDMGRGSRSRGTIITLTPEESYK